jgi:hypothetical protein
MVLLGCEKRLIFTQPGASFQIIFKITTALNVGIDTIKVLGAEFRTIGNMP